MCKIHFECETCTAKTICKIEEALKAINNGPIGFDNIIIKPSCDLYSPENAHTTCYSKPMYFKDKFDHCNSCKFGNVCINNIGDYIENVNFILSEVNDLTTITSSEITCVKYLPDNTIQTSCVKGVKESESGFDCNYKYTIADNSNSHVDSNDRSNYDSDTDLIKCVSSNNRNLQNNTSWRKVWKLLKRSK